MLRAVQVCDRFPSFNLYLPRKPLLRLGIWPYNSSMEKITRNVRELENNERRVYETALGQQLRDNQQVIIQVITVGASEEKEKVGSGGQPTGTLPDWCNVYEGLSDEEIAEIETVILDRSGWSRNSQ